MNTKHNAPKNSEYKLEKVLKFAQKSKFFVAKNLSEHVRLLGNSE